MKDSNPKNTRDLFGAAIWLQVLAATSEYERLLASGQQPDSRVFAELYPNVPSEVLLPELQRSLEEHLGSLTPSKRTPKTSSTQSSELNSTERYSDLETIGSGGMGEVYRGIDHECMRPVAIKKIRKEQRFNPDAQKRFKTEIELTAQLEHPGIIPLYGKGVDSQGREFYAMRLIAGDGTGTLDDAIQSLHAQVRATNNRWNARHIEQLRNLVRRLVAVTDTIAYAHSRGIVHRDIKPANILLGAYGETLISDWGLARKIDPPSTVAINKAPEDTARHPGSDTVVINPELKGADKLPSSDASIGVGTPGYAAPELAQRHQVQYLPLCDVYSIGAILLRILNGKKSKGNPTRLHSKWRSPTLSALEAIGRKATATDLEQRYSCVEQLRSDLQNWIASEPLIATTEGFFERAIRWPNRHRVAAVGIASTFLITMLAGSLIVWLQSRHSRAIESKAQQLAEALDKSNYLLEETRQAKKAAEELQQLAEVRQKEAINSRLLAEKRGVIAFEGLLNFQELLTTNQELFQSPELAQLNESLSGQSKKIFATILADLEAEYPPAPKNLVRLTELTHRLAAMESQQKNDDDAYELFNRSCDWMSRILDRKDLPDHTKLLLQVQIGKLRSLQGLLSMRVGRNQQAKPQLEESIRRLEPMLNESQLSVEERSIAATAFAGALSAMSMQELFAGNLDDAKVLQQRALAILGDQKPIKYEDAMMNVQVHGNMSRIYENLNEPEKALSELERAATQIDDAEELILETPGGIWIRDSIVRPTQQHLSVRSQLAHERARLLMAKQDSPAAISVLKTLFKRDSANLSQFPNDPRFIASYQTTASTLVALMMNSGEHLAAIKLLENWEKLAQDLLDRNTPSEANLQFHIVAFHSAGHAFEKLEKRDLALEKYQSAIQVCDQAELLRFRSAANCSQRVELEIHSFLLRLPTSSWEEVETHFNRAVRAAEELNALPASAGNVVTIARTQLSQGLDAMRSAGKETEAAAWSEKLEKLQLIRPSPTS
jgi:serine/threonine protein kinase